VDAAGLYKAYAKGVAASGTMKLAMSKATYDAGTGAVDVSITLTDIKPNANSPSYIKNLISSLAKDAVGKEFTEKAVSMKDRKITWTKETKDIKLVVNADITTGYASMVITATLDVKSAWIKMLLSRATFKGSAVLV
jgi:hypothetical protein